MKVIFIDVRKCRSYLLLAAVAISILVILSVTHTGDVSKDVFSESRELPIYFVDTEERTASITFDCAWGADDIPIILDTLNKENIKASFFMVGQWAERFPDAVKAIAAAGHDIGNHSYSHLRMGALDKSRITSEISKCSDSLSKISGKKVELFRAPYGDYSSSLVTYAKQLGYFTIQWNVDSLDWKPGISAESIKSRVSQKIKPGSIILFHNDTAYTARILPDIIKLLKKEGYNFVPVSKLIFRDDYIIDSEGRQKNKN